MDDSAKYLIHADVTANGVVERSDVVGAIFGQTEGLLGREMDLRTLQEASKVGRIDVDVDSEGGRSFGRITIASNLDRIETAVLGAALETIDRVGPCRAELRVTGIEDVRAAKRREVVERAKELATTSFDESVMTTQEILEEVRRSVRAGDITEYEGLPAGPNVADSDAIVVVEGRADVLQLLGVGVKNAIAVEGTDVPDAIAELTRDRTVTAFLDGDRGGELILKELAQVGEVDYVALAPPDRSVEDLSRGEVTTALREKIPYEMFAEADVDPASDAVASTADADDETTRLEGTLAAGTSVPETETGRGQAVPSGGGQDATADAGSQETESDAESQEATADAGVVTGGDRTDAGTTSGVTEADEAGGLGDADDGTDDADREESGGEAAEDGGATDGVAEEGEAIDGDEEAGGAADERGGSDEATGEDEADATDATDEEDDAAEPATLQGHVREVIDAGSGTVRLLDGEYGIAAERPAAEAFEAVEAAEDVPAAVVLDGELTQRVLDVAAQRGVEQVVARVLGDFVKRPTGVRIRTADQLLVD